MTDYQWNITKDISEKTHNDTVSFVQTLMIKICGFLQRTSIRLYMRVYCIYNEYVDFFNVHQWDFIWEYIGYTTNINEIKGLKIDTSEIMFLHINIFTC